MYFLSSRKFFCTFWLDANCKSSFFNFFGKLGHKLVVFSFHHYFPFYYKNNIFFFSPSRNYTNTIRSVFSNVYSGLTSGYFRYIELKGVGFRVLYSPYTHSLFFFLGYNHVISYYLPISVQIKVRKQYILLFSYDKSVLSYICSQIKSLRFPDPYRGKGVLFRDEVLKFKPGKQR